MNHPELSIPQAQQEVDNWIKTIGKGYFSELTNLAILMEEMGELARLVARRYGQQKAKPTESQHDISEELADVFFVLLCLCNQTDTNLQDAFRQSVQKKIQRDQHRFS